MGFLNDIGLPGLIIIVVAALIIFGPKKLPELGSSVGKMIRELKKSVSETDECEDKKESENTDNENNK